MTLHACTDSTADSADRAKVLMLLLHLPNQLLTACRINCYLLGQAAARTCCRRVSKTCRHRTMLGCATMRTNRASPARIFLCTAQQSGQHSTLQQSQGQHSLQSRKPLEHGHHVNSIAILKRLSWFWLMLRSSPAQHANGFPVTGAAAAMGHSADTTAQHNRQPLLPQPSQPHVPCWSHRLQHGHAVVVLLLLLLRYSCC